MPILTLDALNRLPAEGFSEAFGAIFEYAPWVAEAIYARRPLPTVTALQEAMVESVAKAGEARQMALNRAHPDLGSHFARAEPRRGLKGRAKRPWARPAGR